MPPNNNKYGAFNKNVCIPVNTACIPTTELNSILCVLIQRCCEVSLILKRAIFNLLILFCYSLSAIIKNKVGFVSWYCFIDCAIVYTRLA